MREWIGFFAIALLIMFAVASCSPILAPSVAPPPEVVPTTAVADPTEVADDTEEEGAVFDAAISNEPVSQAKEDLSHRLDIPVETIEVLEARNVNWSDTSLGCAKPGIVYAQASQEGMLIRLSADGEMYFYHSGNDQEPFLCEETAKIVPNVTPEVDEFVPPPDSEID